MCGNRLYYMIIILKSGEKLEKKFWSKSKKGSADNFIDGLVAMHQKYGKEKIDGNIADWGISYAQTSLSR